MQKLIEKAITTLYYILFLLIPLILNPETSEIFEFNKMVVVYIFTVLVVSLWIIKSILNKNLVFKKTFLDIPLVAFLISQTISTVLSIDTRTSVFGYYSRFHGGLLSSFSYALLYWGYVANMNSNSTKKAFGYIFISSLIAAVWAILEHFGHSFSCLIFPGFRTFDVSCWVQDVQNRVYSTFGQPNWLAAWIVAIIPLTWSLAVISGVRLQKPESQRKYPKILLWLLLSCVYFSTLLFTKSRSGILAFSIGWLLFWLGTVITWLKLKQKNFDLLKVFFIFNFSFLILILFFGTPWTPKLANLTSNQKPITSIQPVVTGPALEVGGTESGEIRKIVWKGAFEIWKHYPIVGSGVETFAYSYYAFRPKEHNLVSEWDYLYNKAHNEYLNFAATTGTVGLSAYLILIVFSFFQISKQAPFAKHQKADKQGQFEINQLKIALAAGFVSISITNFFGFSTVAVAILFFLYPAFAVSLGQSEKDIVTNTKISSTQKTFVILILCAMTYALLTIFNYWYTDFLYAKGVRLNNAGNPIDARNILAEVVVREPNESAYWDELAQSTASLAILNFKQQDKDLTKKLSESTYTESLKATTLSPANVNLKRNFASRLVNLSQIDPNYMIFAKKTLEEATDLAPTDAKLLYNLSLAYLRSGNYENAIATMEKTISLKDDYALAHYALALMYIDTERYDEAKIRLEYVLNTIDPNFLDAKRQLEDLGI